MAGSRLWDPAVHLFAYMFPVPDCRVPGHQILQSLMGWTFPQVGQHRQYQQQVFIGINTVGSGCFHQRVHTMALDSGPLILS